MLSDDALAARTEANASEAPSGRIEAGTQLCELERLGEWVLVETPSGDHWWVDGRRLSVATPDTAPEPPPPPTAAENGTQPAPTSSESREQRFPRLLVGIVLLAVVLAGLGGALLLTRSGPTTTRVVRGWFPLEAEPEILVSDAWDSQIFLLSEGTLIQAERGVNSGLRFSSSEQSGVGRVSAAAGVRKYGLAWLTDEPAVEVLGATSDRILLPPGDYAPVIAVSFLEPWVFVFPEEGGRSSSFLSVDLESGAIEEHELADSVAVVSAVFDVLTLYVGHSNGVLAHHVWIDDAVCASPFRSFELGNVDLARMRTTFAEGPVHLSRVVALDRDRDQLNFFYFLGGEFERDSPCGARTAPAITETIDLGVNVGAEARVVAGKRGLNSVYVLTADGDLLIVELGLAGDRLQRERITIIPDLGEAQSDIALYSARGDAYHAFVADENRLWWIAPDGPEGRGPLNLAEVNVSR